MELSIIVARGANGGIGKSNQLLWKLPNDMQFFKSTTQGAVVITGRKNYESIPEKFRPLPGRINCILTHKKDYQAPGAFVFNQPEDLMKFIKEHYSAKKVFVIGGGEIYSLFMDTFDVKHLYITEVNDEPDADTFFPRFDEKNYNNEVMLKQLKDDKHAFDFKVIKYSKI